jgi:putative tryptophan/tyrosine transport system substrate-binding protein
MRRRDFIAGLGGAGAWPMVARAQQRRTRLPVIGVLWFSNAPFPMAPFRQGLADQGFVIGENIAIDFEFPVQFARLSTHAVELVERRVDVIFVAASLIPVRAVMSATTTIPIVFSYGGDPVEDGLVSSLSHPGGNVTGITSQGTELTSKRLGLLHEVVPSAKTIAFLTTSTSHVTKERVLAAAQSLGLNVLIFEAGNDREVERTFMEIAERRAEALVVDNTPVASNLTSRIIALADRQKIPAMYPFTFQVWRGGLISYSTAIASFREAAARYVVPILKGAKPSELPVLLPTKFELVINLNTANALGLTIPETLLATADEVIQ